ncbi:uracil-DNA glycosylase [Thermosulfuriphilus ammonigenes]|uniref:Type-4 uracil-DNA glycosylase n=1 Tax=Thermosulfuriphilus ammonigenes TaxID=1936021 RepID=A0A6G7PUZ6_9BACT|nr:uracil-DNA glycosylase [Thermosulfuriphilus ammonigenes]MBA2848361.1 DNA polymerase [Thermosulfuriphilus ammonigenes]QIJ71482.1 uracil-DNA glycosylase [Thermosulfuriphilus ammonigenes]HFB83984.1 uracil-DNA glycosylase [Thermodesulfatator sp.]
MKDQDLISALETLITYYRELGFSRLPVGEPGGKAMDQTLRPKTMAEVRALVNDCQRCPLHQTRTNIVFGEGSESASLLLVGEAPGRDEDLQGRPFVGAAGQLLTRMLKAIDLQRSQVYIANVLKCRPPKNRNPRPEEIEACFPYLEMQIRVISPRVIACLGTFAAQTILKTREPIGRLRGRVFEAYGAQVVPTYHPAFLLYNPNFKRAAWEDLKLIRRLLDAETPFRT